MENIRFITSIASWIERQYIVAGDAIYYNIGNENRAKAWCDSSGVLIEIINKRTGKVDGIHFPFARYFSKKRCSAGSPLWDQHITRGKWQFEGQYSHVMPNGADYKSIAYGIESYIALFADD